MKKNSRRSFLQQSALAAGAIGFMSFNVTLPQISSAASVAVTGAGSEVYPFKLPVLDFAYNALEPYIDTATMQLHHDKHHQAYIDKLNAALEKHLELQAKTLGDLFSQLTTLPEDVAKAVRNHGGGHYNHSLFWKILTAEKNTAPSDSLMQAINTSFTSMDKLKEEMGKAALSIFGSGWAWLVMDAQKKLSVTTTANQENTLMADAKVKGTPILGIDVWEHAYYLQYQQRRGDYLNNIWNVINWKQVSVNFG